MEMGVAGGNSNMEVFLETQIRHQQRIYYREGEEEIPIC